VTRANSGVIVEIKQDEPVGQNFAILDIKATPRVSGPLYKES